MFDDMKQRVHLGLGECYEGNATDDATAVGDDSLNDASKILGNDSTDHKLFLVERAYDRRGNEAGFTRNAIDLLECATLIWATEMVR